MPRTLSRETQPPTAQMAPKLTRNSKAVQLLIAKFRSGELSGRENTKDVYESNPLFKNHRLSTSLTRYNVLRKEFARDEGMCKYFFDSSAVPKLIFLQ